MDGLRIGAFARSRKENERRLPLHPAHLADLGGDVAGNLFLERGYGEPFGMPDGEIEPLIGGVRTREELIADCDMLLLPKPMHSDVAEMRSGAVLWGWMHLVQDPEITQLAIDRRLTMITWETMNRWRDDGSFDLHVFHRNNELAGYSAVQHALQLAGLTGRYGRELRAAVVGFGATGRGAVTALSGLGIHDISVLTQREVAEVVTPAEPIRLITYARDPDRPGETLELDSEEESVAEFLAGHDVIVNCMFQDTDAPVILVTRDELGLFGRRTLFVDVSADDGMGFEWSRPTSFEDPTFEVGGDCLYYAVDHTPSLLWDSATWEVSEALIPFLPAAIAGPEAWEADPTLRRAVEIRDGRVLNPKILSFQGRSEEHPHARAAA